MTIHLIVSARSCSDVDTIVQHLKAHYVGAPLRLSLSVRPTCGGAAYELLQRHVPDCRLVVTWGEQEALMASGASWRCRRAIWWPVDHCGLPGVQDVFDLAGYSEALDENTRRPLVVSLAGYRGREALRPNGHSCQAVDLPLGAVAFQKRLLSSLLACGDKLSGVPLGGWSLGLAVAMTRRVPCYVVPTGPETAGISEADCCRAVEMAASVGWRSRVID